MFKILPVLLVPIALTVAASAQEPAATAAKSNRTIGEVTAIDGSTLTIKPDAAGGTVSISLDTTTKYLKVPAKEPDIKKATKINASDISVGDRVLAVMRAAEPQKASTIVVMTKEDLAQKQAADRAEWQRRGIGGTITAVDPAKNEVTVDTRTRDGKKSVVVETADAKFRRYAPDSIRFSDAKPSSISEFKVGDQLRVLGDKNADETRVKAQEIVGGTFHNVAGTVKSIDPMTGEIQITNLETKKPMTVKVNPDSTLRRLPEQMANMLAMRLNAGAGGNGGPGGAAGMAGGAPRMQRPEGAPAGQGAQAGGQQWRGGPGGQRSPGGQTAGGPGGFGGPGGPAGPGGPGGFGRGAASGDLSQMIERLPALQLSELKSGDAIIVASTAGADPSRATAITVLAGVEPLLTAPRQQEGRALGGQWNFDINIVPQ